MGGPTVKSWWPPAQQAVAARGTDASYVLCDPLCNKWLRYPCNVVFALSRLLAAIFGRCEFLTPIGAKGTVVENPQEKQESPRPGREFESYRLNVRSRSVSNTNQIESQLQVVSNFVLASYRLHIESYWLRISIVSHFELALARIIPRGPDAGLRRIHYTAA